MKHRKTLVAGLAVGFAVMAPAAAFATTGTATPTAPPSSPSAPTSAPTTAPPTSDPGGVPKAYISVSPHSGVPGQKVKVAVGCEAGYISHLSSDALDIGKLHQVGPQDDPKIAPRSEAAATVKKGAKVGSHKVSFDCGGATITTSFTLLTPKAPPSSTVPSVPAAGQQVTKVPKGAPQTGGGGTADPASYTGLIAALVGSGLLVAGAGAGTVVYRRRQSARQN
jgi:hypothetical protein